MDTTETTNFSYESINSKDENFSFYRYAIIYGLIAGGVMSAYRLVLRLVGANGNITFDFLTFLFLGPILWWAIANYKYIADKKAFFRSSIQLGLIISLIAGIVLAAFSLISYAIDVQAIGETRKYFFEATSLAQVFVIDVIWLLQCIVFGMIWTFIILQFKKHDIGTR